MGYFKDAMARFAGPKVGKLRWVYAPYDQLHDSVGPLARSHPRRLGLVLIESEAWLSRRAYHKQRLALQIANQRQFALEQARRGVQVRYVCTSASPADVLRELSAELGPLCMMRPAERELRVELAPLVEDGLLQELANDMWLTTSEDFQAAFSKRDTYRMDAFYRYVRRKKRILMDGRRPLGGRFSFDGENRKPYSGDPPLPELPSYTADRITQEVAEEVQRRFSANPGRVDLAALPSTRDDAEKLWRFGLASCLPHFGPYQDAMVERSNNLFHTRISGLVNMGRLLPKRLMRDVLALDIPLASKEGFVRQLLGWREYVRHVHEATDGFRELPPGLAARAETAEAMPLPPAFWGTTSGLHCLDKVVDDVWKEGYSHHITRLMVLGNIATLLDVSPRELTDWFWVAYVDAYDWVVEPNVLAMGTFSVGELMTTKPYVAGAAYIKRMSDHCESCAFDPNTNCPLTRLYWGYLQRHEPHLKENARMRLPMIALGKRDAAKKDEDQRLYKRVRGLLEQGKELTPSNLAVSEPAASGAKASEAKTAVKAASAKGPDADRSCPAVA
jgi:deoxyribodipyrimidine photolyase-related protein